MRWDGANVQAVLRELCPVTLTQWQQATINENLCKTCIFANDNEKEWKIRPRKFPPLSVVPLDWLRHSLNLKHFCWLTLLRIILRASARPSIWKLSESSVSRRGLHSPSTRHSRTLNANNLLSSSLGELPRTGEWKNNFNIARERKLLLSVKINIFAREAKAFGEWEWVWTTRSYGDNENSWCRTVWGFSEWILNKFSDSTESEAEDEESDKSIMQSLPRSLASDIDSWLTLVITDIGSKTNDVCGTTSDRLQLGFIGSICSSLHIINRDNENSKNHFTEMMNEKLFLSLTQNTIHCERKVG